ncbi:MAG: hypothetical protein M1820_010354 [Bogoriella megaspora]|nr:MAG: hypothetical protein M1820_010354 [Bogoriella megaspora]
MRLLDTTTLDLHTFNGPTVPYPYAILSHTWGPEEDEVLFEDVKKGTAKPKRAYAKIKSCADLAISHNYKYVWIDTCCIDKSSSSELQEAINSMFRWYQGADVCYAYLADVGTPNDVAGSKWFTRGWTLQELIAPQEVQFYSKEWHCIGRRSDQDFRDKLVLITDIRESALNLRPVYWNEYMESLSIAERMSWAAKRQTTRVEDIAYCLLGIFGVNMPLLYGEGSNAFMRLQEEIMKISSDKSIFAWENGQLVHQAVSHVDNYVQGSTTNYESLRDVIQSRSTPSFYGLLAESPMCFEKCQNFTYAPNYTEVHPTTVMSTGLVTSFHLRILSLNDSCYYADLGCYDRVKGKSVGIVLRRLTIRDEYVRIFPGLLLSRILEHFTLTQQSWSVLHWKDWGLKQIRVRSSHHSRPSPWPTFLQRDQSYSIGCSHDHFATTDHRRLLARRHAEAEAGNHSVQIIQSYPPVTSSESRKRVLGFNGMVSVTKPIQLCGVLIVEVMIGNGSKGLTIKQYALAVALHRYFVPIMRVADVTDARDSGVAESEFKSIFLDEPGFPSDSKWVLDLYTHVLEIKFLFHIPFHRPRGGVTAYNITFEVLTKRAVNIRDSMELQLMDEPVSYSSISDTQTAPL